jgi:sugar phosphate permease
MHMSGQDWNTAFCVFFATYALGGIPSNIALKRYGPKFWLPALLTACGIMTVCTGLQSSMGGFTAFRLLLGIVEAGIYPRCSIVLTNWFSSKEIQGRMSIFYSAASLAGGFSGLLA